MKGQIIRLLFLLIFADFTLSEYTLLNGKHLIVGVQDAEGHLYVKRNISGHIIQIDGVAVMTLVALANRYNFTFSILQVNDTRLEKESEDLPGLTYYLQIGKCDLVIGTLVMTPARYAIMDFAEGYAYSSVVIIIPMPESLDNGGAILRPFQTSVWVGLILIMPITAVAIYFSIYPDVNWNPKTDGNATIERSVSTRIRHFLYTTSDTFFKMVSILLNQAVYFPRMRNALYFVVGSWCLGALILISAYDSLLISYILGSNAKPLVDSFPELLQNSNVQVVVDKGRGLEIFLLTAEHGSYKNWGNKMRSQSRFSCATRKECIGLVKLGSYAYLNTKSVAIRVIDEDYKATGKCNLALASQAETIPGSFAWALRKRDPFSRLFAKGFMELHEAGQVEFWTKLDQKKYINTTYCLNVARERQQQRKFSESRSKINLNNLSGAFYVLAIGYFISFVCFVRENLYFRLSKLKRASKHDVKQQEPNQNAKVNHSELDGQDILL